MNSDFLKNGYVVVRGAVNQQTCSLVANEFRLIRKAKYYFENVDESEKHFFGDNLIKNSFSIYAPLCSEGLLMLLHTLIEEVVGKKLFPCYSYGRIMYNGAFMKRHIDRPSCEYSATLCIEDNKEYPYPLGIKKYDGVEAEVFLKPGDMIVYNGTKLEHWRDEWKSSDNSEHLQTFLHYVDCEGTYKDFKYDGRPFLGI